ncbi:translation initiation factor IF-6 [Candidatus Micrarchaeota archaeon]|nr:translation initiation factor IF-6 [Candidatus Micrarchaeota archaeon]
MIKPPKADFFGNPFLSLYFKANDNFCLGPLAIDEMLIKIINERLEVPLIKVDSGGSDLTGLYTALNNKGVVFSDIFGDVGSETMKQVSKDYNVHLHKSSNVHNANGNNICVNDSGGIINPDITSPEIKKISDVLGVEIIPMEIAGYKTVGSMCMATNSGFICHNETPPEVIKELETIFKVKGINVTVNFGVPFAGTAVIANSNGYLIGSESTGVEVQRVEEALDLMR